MYSLLSPGIRLLGRFTFAGKFRLLFLLFMLPLVVSLAMLGNGYRERLNVISGERQGVTQLQALEAVDRLLSQLRMQAARWKAVDILREPTPAAKAAINALEATGPQLTQALAQLGQVLGDTGASAESMRRYQALQQGATGLSVQGLRGLGWWPDGFDRFTAVISTLQLLREQLAMDSGLILDPWMETYLLMEMATQRAPDLNERVGRLAAVGEASVVSGQFSLQSRLQLRDLRSRINDAREQLFKSGAALNERLPEASGAWTGQYGRTAAMLDKVLKLLDEQLFGGTVNLSAADFDSNMDALVGEVVALRQQSLTSLDQRLAFYRADALGEFIPVAVGFAVLLLAALYLFICVQTAIRRSAAGITTLAESLRDGDLRVQVAVTGRDELAAISQALNSAVVQLRGSLAGVGRETDALGGAVSTLTAQASGTLQDVEQQQLQISQIATAATQLAATSQGVARSCEEAAQSARHTQQIAMSSSRQSELTTRNIQQLNERLSATAQALGRVSEQGQQIQSVVDVIGGIAGQTNLLALNAAIEAARAGDQGRGFAVVADEVRSLSQRTQASTAQIAATVESLRGTVQQAVELMQAACAQAEGDAAAVTGLGANLGEIAGAVQAVNDTLAQIATAVEQQAATADEVSGNIQQVDQAALRLLEGAREVNSAADRLSEGSRALRANTANFATA
ncbi:methyl-accepting chemotaxis protein [Pseudomonas sp. RIT-PI-S]|uniref:methyl-accepting chemotaxis protein n=1 Tax=Pseudomonas sp. RIT-PI-S TaxID=3035295 RepID=UPI0021D9674F|nr:methyl-accepting chemotaxis protein [Pseudomonas sp. RIT-PI-S]